MIIKLILCISIVAVCRCEKERPLVRTHLGKILGSHRPSYSSRIFSAFEGIPYATPPIGDLRFKESRPINPWEGVWDASHTIECVQFPFMLNISEEPSGNEDCLYLNIYVPRETPILGEKLDVLVYIHGGAFLFSSGHSYAHPQYLMDRDVVFVTLNYRLGIFGFLSTGDEVVPGNSGLKDQVLALKWIQRHIANFGGNPDSVTIFGISAGGISVHSHYLSPLSKGLFHRGFSISGTTLFSGLIQYDPLSNAQILANAVGCPDTPAKILIDCLRQRPLLQLWKAMPLFYGFKCLPLIPLGPTIEKNSSGSFLSELPYVLLKNGHIHDIPWIQSTVSDEGTTFNMYKDFLDEMNDNWEDVASYVMNFNYTLDRSLWKSVARKIKDFYLGEGQDITLVSYTKFQQMVEDRIFLNEADVPTQLHAKFTTSPVYFLRTSYPGDSKKTLGHSEDGQYYFYKMLGNEPTENELKMKDVLLDMLTSFAKTGTPKIKGVIWEPTKSDELTYLDISNYTVDGMKSRTTKKFWKTRDFWRSLGFKEGERLFKAKDEL